MVRGGRSRRGNRRRRSAAAGRQTDIYTEMPAAASIEPSCGDCDGPSQPSVIIKPRRVDEAEFLRRQQNSRVQARTDYAAMQTMVLSGLVAGTAGGVAGFMMLRWHGLLGGAGKNTRFNRASIFTAAVSVPMLLAVQYSRLYLHPPHASNLPELRAALPGVHAMTTIEATTAPMGCTVK